MASASTENVTLSPLLDTIDVLNQSNGTTKEPFVARTDGMLLSYSFLLLAALLCVYFGSYRSVTRKEKQTQSGEKPDVLTARDGKMNEILHRIISDFSLSGNVSLHCQWISFWNLFGDFIGLKGIHYVRFKHLFLSHWYCRIVSSDSTPVGSTSFSGFGKTS